MRYNLASLMLTGLLSACAPHFPAPEPEMGQPYLTDTALITADGTALPLHAWRPTGEPRAVILALHGFNDYGLFFGDPGDFLALRGIVSYSYDQRGFGGAPNPGNLGGCDDIYARRRSSGPCHKTTPSERCRFICTAPPWAGPWPCWLPADLTPLQWTV